MKGSAIATPLRWREELGTCNRSPFAMRYIAIALYPTRSICPLLSEEMVDSLNGRCQELTIMQEPAAPDGPGPLGWGEGAYQTNIWQSKDHPGPEEMPKDRF